MRHVSILAIGTTLAQGINVTIMPLLSRMYSPADFGIMASFVSVTTILMGMSGFRYHYAIPFPKNERYAKALVVLSFILQAVFVVFISVVLMVFGRPLLTKISMDILIPYRLLIPIGVAGMGAYIALTQWAIREKLFKTLARTKITQSISGVLTKVILGLLGIRPLGLLLGSIVGQAGGITALAKSLLQNKGFPKPTLDDVKRVAFRYYKFPMFETWSGVLNTLGAQIMPVLLVVLFTPQVAGFFAMAQTLLYIPTTFIGQAIGQVFLQRASAARYEGKIKDVSTRAYSILFQLGLYPILILSLFAPSVFSFILGERWLEAGYFARIIGPWIAFAFACSPMDVLFSVLEMQGTRLIIEITQSLLRITAIVIGGFLGGAYWAVGLFSFVGFSIYLIKLFIIMKHLGNSIRETFNAPIKKAFVSFGLLFFPLLSVFLDSSFLFQLFLTFLSSVLYLILAYVAFRRRTDY